MIPASTNEAVSTVIEPKLASPRTKLAMFMEFQWGRPKDTTIDDLTVT
jgi:hypothetical protein